MGGPVCAWMEANWQAAKRATGSRLPRLAGRSLRRPGGKGLEPAARTEGVKLDGII